MKLLHTFILAVLSLQLAAIDITFENTFKTWKSRQFFADKKVKVSDRYSIALIDTYRLPDVVSGLKPNTLYEFSFYVKGAGISSGKGEGAWIMISRWDKVKKRADIVTTRPNREKETGTFDWRKGTYIIDTALWGTTIRFDLFQRGKGMVRFDELRLTELKAKQKEVSFRTPHTGELSDVLLVPRGTHGFFDPQQPVTADIFFRKKPQVKKVEYSAVVKDESGKVVHRISRRTAEKEMHIPGQPCGYYSITADFYADGKKAYTIQGGFAVNRRIEKRDPFFQIGFGMMQMLWEGYKRIGIGAVSLKLKWWSDLNRTPEQILKFTGFNHYLGLGGFKMRAVFSATLEKKLRSKELLDAGFPVLNDALISRAKEFIALAVKQANGRVKDWTIQQETPSSAVHKDKLTGTWSEAMANLVILTRVVSREIRKSLPDATIYCGGNNVQKYFQDVERITLADIVDEFDRYIIDAYTGNWDMTLGKVIPEKSLRSMYLEASALAASFGKSKMIGNEETGYSINYGAPFDSGLAVDQAELTARLILLTRVSPVSHFELHKPNYYLPKAPKDSDGCMTTVWKPVQFNGKLYHVPQPGGAMYATAAAQLAFVTGPRYFNSGDYYCCVFDKPDGSTLLTLWNIKEKTPVKLTLPADTLMVNMYGREKQLKAGSHILEIGTAPVYLNLKYPSAKIFDTIKKVLISYTPEVKCSGYYISDTHAGVFLRNMLNTAVTGVLKSSDGVSRKVSLVPGKVTQFTLKTSGKSVEFTSASGRKYSAPLNRNSFYAVPGIADTDIKSSNGAWYKNIPSLTLKYPDHVRPAAALQQELCYFKCPMNPNGHSVSAKYRTACGSKYFYIAAEVDDPVHIQRFSGLNIWKDDSIQLAFSTKNDVPSELLTDGEKAGRELVTFGIALAGNKPLVVKYSGKDAGVKDYPVRIVRKNNRTYYEAAIPLSAIGGKPKRFGIVVFDNNFREKPKSPYWLQSCDGIAGGSDAAKLQLILYKR